MRIFLEPLLKLRHHNLKKGPLFDSHVEKLARAPPREFGKVLPCRDLGDVSVFSFLRPRVLDRLNLERLACILLTQFRKHVVRIEDSVRFSGDQP